MYFSYKGKKTLTLAEWSDLTGMPYSTLARDTGAGEWSTEGDGDPVEGNNAGEEPRRPNEASATRLIFGEV